MSKIQIISTAEEIKAHLENLNSRPPCNHEGKKDMSQRNKTKHLYCPKCDWHYYDGREWTKAEWEKYVNDFTTPTTVEPYFSH